MYRKKIFPASLHETFYSDIIKKDSEKAVFP